MTARCIDSDVRFENGGRDSRTFPTYRKRKYRSFALAEGWFIIDLTP